MSIGFVTILDATQFIIKLLTNRSRLSIFRNHIRLAILKVVNTFDRTDNGSSTTSSRFFESAQLFFGTGRRSTFMPISSANCIKLLLVMEGRMEVDFGVM